MVYWSCKLVCRIFIGYLIVLWKCFRTSYELAQISLQLLENYKKSTLYYCWVVNAPLYILINSRDIAIEPTYWHVHFMKWKQLKCKKGCFSYSYTRKLYKYMSLHILFFRNKKKNQTNKHKNTHTTSYIN